MVSSYQDKGERNGNPLSYQHDTNEKTLDLEDDRPTNEYVLNVAFLSFIGFTIFEAIFALIVKSESMLADAEAMAVDAMTYLFNLCAERIKKAPYTESELRMPADVREHRRKMKRLYLELFPPLISVTTLLAVTVLTLRDSLHTLFGEDNEEESSVTEDEKAGVMLSFSALNLALDVMNVMCFARADQAFGLSVMKSQEEFRKSLQSTRPEDLALLENARMRISYDEEGDGIEVKEWNASRSRSFGEDSEDSYALVNLNMCSAWTHVCADTMRSIAVLVAAAIAFLFKSVSADAADAAAAVVVSFIILISLLPLLQGLFLTATEILHSSKRHPQAVVETMLVV